MPIFYGFIWSLDFADAKIWTLPSGLRYEENYIHKEFTTPSGFKIWAIQLIQIKIAFAEYNVWDGYPQLKRICSCESWGNNDKKPRQFRNDGSLLWGNDPETGKPVEKDVGACQISTKYWLKDSKKLGYDIFTYDGNIGFAKWLYDKKGSEPWNPSRQCWK